ncbi:MAG: THUMP domain-containing protein [Desulfurococcales archaeon]|nr:THUMP domain-containing protein [Desulfurococcales archaeon]
MHLLKLLVTGNPGLEDIMALEAKEELGNRLIEVVELPGRGRIIVSLRDSSTGTEPFLRMRSIHNIVLLLAEERVGASREALDRIREVVGASEVHRYLLYGATFAVEAERLGEGHEYTSLDIARIVGDSVIDTTLRKQGWRPRVRLNSPQIVVYAEVDKDVFRLGILLSGEHSRHRRGYRIYDHPAALKPSIAYSMLRIVGARDGETILDPMCGGGTIAVEAALLFESSRIICIDKNPGHIKGAIANATVAGVKKRIEFIVGDARRLQDYLEAETIDTVVSNPPYGIRMGSPSRVKSLYEDFINSLNKVVKKGGKVALITTEEATVREASRRAGLKIVESRKVRHGDLWVSIITILK